MTALAWILLAVLVKRTTEQVPPVTTVTIPTITFVTPFTSILNLTTTSTTPPSWVSRIVDKGFREVRLLVAHHNDGDDAPTAATDRFVDVLGAERWREHTFHAGILDNGSLVDYAVPNRQRQAHHYDHDATTYLGNSLLLMSHDQRYGSFGNTSLMGFVMLSCLRPPLGLGLYLLIISRASG